MCCYGENILPNIDMFEVAPFGERGLKLLWGIDGWWCGKVAPFRGVGRNTADWKHMAYLARQGFASARQRFIKLKLVRFSLLGEVFPRLNVWNKWRFSHIIIGLVFTWQFFKLGLSLYPSGNNFIWRMQMFRHIWMFIFKHITFKLQYFPICIQFFKFLIFCQINCKRGNILRCRCSISKYLNLYVIPIAYLTK